MTIKGNYEGEGASNAWQNVRQGENPYQQVNYVLNRCNIPERLATTKVSKSSCVYSLLQLTSIQ